MSLLADGLMLEESLRSRMIDAPGAAVLEDRRVSPRARRKLEVTLTTLGDAAAVECHTIDIGEGGMCVKAPAGSGLSVGQRLDVTVPSSPNPQTGKPAFVTTCYATVVRSHHGTHEDKGSVMLGLRFDHPFYF